MHYSIQALLSMLLTIIALKINAEDWLANPIDAPVTVEYKSRQQQPATVATTLKTIPVTRQLIDWIATAPAHGLAIPQQDWLRLARNPTPETVHTIAANFAHYLDQGFLDKKYYQPNWHIQDQSIVPTSGTTFDHSAMNTLHLLEPALPEYQVLKKALADLNNQLQAVTKQFSRKLTLKLGEHHALVRPLSQWLISLGLAKQLSRRTYTQQHQAIIKTVQKQARLRPDGLFGHQARQALTALTHERIRILKANMERMRWLPRKMPYPHIRVDITGFKVAWVTSRKQQYTYKAIVGRPYRQTPIFQDQIESITVNPSWRVPHSIASTTLLRKAKQSPEFLKEEGFTIYKSWRPNAQTVSPESINWRQLAPSNFPYHLQQKPGKVNRLGKFKLDSPNHFNVYLHSTDKPQFFNKSMRALSAGCTRVEHIEQLINRMLHSQGLNVPLMSLKQMSETRTIKLRKPIPVYFVYFTAWPDSSGQVTFRDDIYRLDDLLIASL